MHVGEIVSVSQSFTIVKILKLPILHDPDQIADILVVKMKYFRCFMKYDSHFLPPVFNDENLFLSLSITFYHM